MNWKESGSGFNGTEKKWSAYIRQDNVNCAWKLYHEGITMAAGYSDNATLAKARIAEIMDSKKEN